ncbi:uncharacterized protein LOC111712410 [Eurytemora carolleeae]|uniref:uncharacterized protein LOC111712410 n=1 Tax=Eurytemora carolleeae TaxID=1294199 RepID=UPI000C75DDC5|nr:uncharacterized protein LOC111712410 [Eurytemora carolleeae]|eukprot:XP_023342773.1 uncharacterized protein LOC111712410 [Eurytemora affinis]
MEDLKKHLGPPSPVDKTYTSIVNLLLASVHSGKANSTLNLAPFNATLKLAPHNLVKESRNLLLGDNVESIGVGIDPSDSPAEEPKFDDTKNKAAGSLTSMLFWSQDQVTFLSDDHSRTVVCGQFGSGKTLLSVGKMRRYLREKKVSVEKPRALFISCLNPSLVNSYDESNRFITPIFDTSIKVALDEMAQNGDYEILFENAESVCEKMNVDLSRINFCSKLPEFLKEMGKKSGIIVIDEYGDGVPVKQEWKDGKWCQYLNPENQRLLNLDYLSAIPLDSVVTVSIHPDLFDVFTYSYRLIDGLFQESSFQVCSLNKLYRNCEKIVNYYKDLGFTDLDSCIPVTVEGIPPILIPGQFDQYIVYQTAL